MNVTQPVLRAGEIPDKWYSEKRLTSLKSTREGASSEMRGGSPGPREHCAQMEAKVSGSLYMSCSGFEKEMRASAPMVGTGTLRNLASASRELRWAPPSCPSSLCIGEHSCARKISGPDV